MLQVHIDSSQSFPEQRTASYSMSKALLSVPSRRIGPSVYKKAKDADTEDREAVLVRGLKDLLKKEGLSSHPSDKGEHC
jgi:hypothetical protein